MTFEYTTDENDYLQYHLYTSSKTKRNRNQRLRSYLFVVVVCALIGLYFLSDNKSFLFYYCMVFGIISLIFFPFYQRNHYKNHYKKQIKEIYKNRFGIFSKINLNEQDLEIFSSNTEAKIKYDELEAINEIGEYIFLKMKSGGSLIIPKLKIENLTVFKDEIIAISNKYKIPVNIELNWKWK